MREAIVSVIRDMNLPDLIPDIEVVLALEPEELGLHILRVLGSWPRHDDQFELSKFVNTVIGHPQTPNQGAYPANQRQAIREAWAGLGLRGKRSFCHLKLTKARQFVFLAVEHVASRKR
jgi:hypothetical protein